MIWTGGKDPIYTVKHPEATEWRPSYKRAEKKQKTGRRRGSPGERWQFFPWAS
jgi:hypothetical protein